MSNQVTEVSLVQVEEFIASKGFPNKRINSEDGSILIVHPNSPIVNTYFDDSVVYEDAEGKILNYNAIEIPYVHLFTSDYIDGQKDPKVVVKGIENGVLVMDLPNHDWSDLKDEFLATLD